MKQIISIFIVLGLVASCASGIKKEIELEKKEIGQVKTEAEVISKATLLLKNSNLSQEKKDQFVEIYKNHRKDLNKITDEIKIHRVLLVKAMTSKKFSHKKFNRIKNHLKELVNKRFDIYIHQFIEGKKVIGADVKVIYDNPWFERVDRF